MLVGVVVMTTFIVHDILGLAGLIQNKVFLGRGMVIIHFSNPKKAGADFPYLLSMIPNSFMSRHGTIVVPGGKMSYAMDLILTPIIHNMIERRNA